MNHWGSCILAGKHIQGDLLEKGAYFRSQLPVAEVTYLSFMAGASYKNLTMGCGL